MLATWRRAGLLPSNVRGPAAAGGRGTTSATPPEALTLVLWLSDHARPGRRPTDVALEAFAAGLPIPEATIRDAWLSTATSLALPETPPEVSAEAREGWVAEVADAAVARESHHPVLLPRRIRDLDARVAAVGFSWAAPEIAAFDKGPGTDEPFTRRDYVHLTVSAVLGGTAQFDDIDLAGYARALAPAGAAVPVASMLEHPDDNPALAEIHDGNSLTLLPAGDIRKALAGLINEASLSQLRAAWKAVEDLHEWAESLCANAEHELDLLAAGVIRDAWPGIQAWCIGSLLGANRSLLIAGLRDPAPTSSARAHLAVTLLFITTALNRLRILVPGGQFELLPDLLPPFLTRLTELIADPRAPT
ncbi:hypothetical protein [Cryptosporangium phraense]|uniref:Uncharacterized protein n=1 Tax=Cryptosporangium phraense TaxID=2593070 RepID=A0A545AV01_9ACTN|nr:hypothetical protein [Cryptosporangium phraense]TQS45144.1 hypothetical protein FL583_11665 [Cryptosporangium phraense]